MNRITVEDVRAAYQKTGIVPTCGIFVNFNGCGCPLFALWVAACGTYEPLAERRVGKRVMDWATPIYTLRYLYSFISGVDGGKFIAGESFEGWNDGFSVREEFFLKRDGVRG